MADPMGHEITQRELRRRTFVPREEVMAAFAAAAVVDPDRLRADLDADVERDPFDREW
jgi:hypothetical protein